MIRGPCCVKCTVGVLKVWFHNVTENINKLITKLGNEEGFVKNKGLFLSRYVSQSAYKLNSKTNFQYNHNYTVF